MPGGPAGADVVNPLETLFRFGVVGDVSDEQLLDRFVTARDGANQAAFTALVDRHGPMVLRVCREVLGNVHDAQDAFQATFLVLVRKAGLVRKPDSLAGWLHGVAYRVARRARANAVRQRTLEQRVGAMSAVALAGGASAAETCAELHQEVAGLPQRYREPVVLCYLEGMSTEEAALRIGCPVGTVHSRLSRARDRLRRRLIRRGLALPAALLAAGLTSAAKAALPATVLKATVRTSLEFAGRRATEAGVACTAATTLARGTLLSMKISQLKTLGAAVMACAFAIGGVQTFGWFGRPDRSQEPASRSAPSADDPQALTESVDKLESELDESTRRNAVMKKQLQDLRARVKSLGQTSEHAALVVRHNIALLADSLVPNPARSVAKFADVLKRHPPRRGSVDGARHQVYMMDLLEGGTTLIADEPVPGLIFSGSPAWSHDGNRIVFDATPGTQWQLSRLMSIEVRDGRPIFTDLGPGDGPTFSPDDRRIAFLLNAGADPRSEAGVWVMNADGSERRRVGEWGVPFWSPDGREFLINSASNPTKSMVINLDSKTGGILKVAGHKIFSYPNWAGPGTLISALATLDEGDSIALLDVRKPEEGKILEVLWQRSPDLDVTPRWPVYLPRTGRCFFVGVDPNKRTLFSIEHGESARVRSVESRGHDDTLGGLSFSPDGRYLLFSANRPDRR
jgi:RNA polymerase sigma factor (sigma-70 family)